MGTDLARSPVYWTWVGWVAVVIAGMVWLRSQPASGWWLLGDRSLTVEAVFTDGSRAKGLSGRASLPADRVMAFVWPDRARRCFWMRETHFPLQLVFLEPTGARLVAREVMDLAPHDLAKKCSEHEYALAVEGPPGLVSIGQSLPRPVLTGFGP